MNFKKGIQDGVAIGIGYFAVSFSFGVAGHQFLSPLYLTLISMSNLTSAGQFAGVKIIEASGSLLEILIATFFINIRYSLMGVSLSQKVLSSFGTKKRLLLSTGITDEIYAVAMGQNTKITASYFAGLMSLPYLGWSSGTFLGAYSGEILPKIVTNALGVALYAMFIAIVVPPMRQKMSISIAVFISIALSLIFYYSPVFSKVSIGFSIVLSAVFASIVAAVFFPIQEKA
ncbi:MAG: AzlC family ABC transporter permease [Fibrobacter sp.]|jgi:predicted branched-subunit amino acid permease|nr:AzlC family ABC transporter permease [Fibrobacter sp.]